MKKHLDWNNQTSIRDVIGGYMTELGKKSQKVLVVNADPMGASRNRGFVEAYPERTYDVSIAEQNLVGFSAGLAREGFLPYAFSMAPFISMRACEQCRTDVAYGNLNVRLVGTYSGVSGGISGATHWGTEDCAILCTMPNMTVLEPSDPVQARKMLDATLTHEGPVYIRCSVEPAVSFYEETDDYRIGKATTLRQGDDGAFLVSGILVKYAWQAAENIEAATGKKIRVVDMHTIKPIDRESVISAAKTGRLLAVQDHSVIGGLGYAVAAVLAEEGIAAKFRILGIPDRFFAMAHAPYLYHQFGYDAEGLEKAMLQLLEG